MRYLGEITTAVDPRTGRLVFGDAAAALQTKYNLAEAARLQAVAAGGVDSGPGKRDVRTKMTSGLWEGGNVPMSHVDWMGGSSAFYGSRGGGGGVWGPDQADPTAFYGQQVDLGAGVMPLQAQMAERSISADFARLMATQPGYSGGSYPVTPSPTLPPLSVPGPEAQPSLPTYTPSSDSSRTDIGIEEAQVPMQVVSAAPAKSGVDSKWLIAAAVIGVFLALRK